MKIKTQGGDASVHAMSDWIAQLREDARPDDLCLEPPCGGAPTPPAATVPSASSLTARIEITEPAAIGDRLRVPIVWCEMGSCISHHADPAALGEADIRARATAAAWRVDALGRLACPTCQQTSSGFWASHPVVPWDRRTAVTMAAQMAAAVGNDRTAGRSAGGNRRAPVVPARACYRPAHRTPGRHQKPVAAAAARTGQP